MSEVVVPDSPWVRAESQKGKWHFCPRELVDGLVLDLEPRGMDDIVLRPMEQAWLDLPGMVLANRLVRTLEMPDYRLLVADQNVEFFAARLAQHQAQGPRRFHDGREYFKVHGWRHCLVLDGRRLGELVVAFDRALPDAARIAAEESGRLTASLQRAVDSGHFVSDRVRPTPAHKRGNWWPASSR